MFENFTQNQTNRYTIDKTQKTVSKLVFCRYSSQQSQTSLSSIFWYKLSLKRFSNSKTVNPSPQCENKQMILERLTSIAFDGEQNIKEIKFLGEQDDEFGRKALIAINAESRLLPLIEQLYQEFADGYEVSYADYSVTSVKIKWEEQNPIKVDIGIKAKSTKFGNYAQSLPSPSTVHITELNSLIRSISEAAFKEFVSYDKAVPAYTAPVYEQTSLFAVPDLALVEDEAA